MLGSVDRSRVVELLDAIAAHDAAGALEVVDAIGSDAADYGDVLGELVNTLHRIAVRQAVPGAADPDPDLAEACARLAERISPEDVQLYYEIGLRGRRDLALVPDPRLGLEMTVLRMLAFALESTAGAPPAGPRAVGIGATPESARAVAALSPASAPIGGRGEAERAGSRPDLTSMDCESWSGMVKELGLSGLAGELASNTSLVEVRNGRLKLELDPTHSALDTPGARRELRRAIAALCDRPIELEIVLNAPSRETLAVERARGEASRREAAIRAIERDPVVRTLCETFDASVDPSLVQPVD